jgi:hypothetical protein
VRMASIRSIKTLHPDSPGQSVGVIINDLLLIKQ